MVETICQKHLNEEEERSSRKEIEVLIICISQKRFKEACAKILPNYVIL